MNVNDFPSYEFQAAWRHVDPNNHVGTSGFLDYATDCRFHYFASKGFPPARFDALGIGPVVLADNIVYRREIRLMEKFRVSISLGGVNAKQSRFIFVNRFSLMDGTETTVIRSMFVWFSKSERKSILPPDDLRDTTLALPKDHEYEDL